MADENPSTKARNIAGVKLGTTVVRSASGEYFARFNAGEPFLPLKSADADRAIRRKLGFVLNAWQEKNAVALLEDSAVERPIESLTTYSPETATLFVNLGRGGVIAVNPADIKIVPSDAAPVAFVDESGFEPLSPAELSDALARNQYDFTLPTLRRVILDRLPAPSPGGLSPGEHVALIVAFLFGIFLRCRAAARPLLVLLGPAGSGKTVTGRALGKLIYGATFDVSGGAGLDRMVKDLAASIKDRSLVVRDEATEAPAGVVDVIAQAATGTAYELAEFHETLRSGRYPAKAALAITAFRPTWMGRPDLLSRLLIVQFGERSTSPLTEEARMRDIVEARTDIWAEIILGLHLATGDAPALVTVSRFADWEALVTPIMSKAGLLDDFRSALVKLPAVAVAFALDADPVAAAVYPLAFEPGAADRWMTAAQVADRLAQLGGALAPHRDAHVAGQTIRNTVALGQLLSKLEQKGSAVVNVRKRRAHNNTLEWNFTPKGP